MIAVALGGRDENGKLTPSTSRPAIAFSSESGPAPSVSGAILESEYGTSLRFSRQ